MTTNPLQSGASVPQYDKIKPEHYMPAVDAALARVTEKVEKIKSESAAPSFGNTVVPLEGLFDEITDIQLILGNVVQNRFTKELHELEGKVNSKVSEFSTKIFQDQQLAKKFDHVYLQRGVLNLDEDDKAVLRDLLECKRLLERARE